MSKDRAVPKLPEPWWRHPDRPPNNPEWLTWLFFGSLVLAVVLSMLR